MEENEDLVRDVGEAVEMALAGDPPGGYELLLVGLQRAREAGEEELVLRYRDALERYATRWQIGRA